MKCKHCKKDDLPINQQSGLCVRCTIDIEQKRKRYRSLMMARCFAEQTLSPSQEERELLEFLTEDTGELLVPVEAQAFMQSEDPFALDPGLLGK